ncbi:MAG: hypothetical protein ABSB80_09995 [Methanoregula sp.]|uniref:hypothetical protein n=1 Tax=Methanoregula sp. TaxID=2052170 RepID=UPI003D11956F
MRVTDRQQTVNGDPAGSVHPKAFSGSELLLTAEKTRCAVPPAGSLRTCVPGLND